MDLKKRKILLEKVEILDESTGRIILKEHASLLFSNNSINSNKYGLDSDNDQQTDETSIHLDNDEKMNNGSLLTNSNDIQNDSCANQFETDLNDEMPNGVLTKLITTTSSVSSPTPRQIIIIENGRSPLAKKIPKLSSSTSSEANSLNSTSPIKQNLFNSGLSHHIVQNYSILAQEITAPIDTTNTKAMLASSSESYPNTVNLSQKSKKLNSYFELSTSTAVSTTMSTSLDNSDEEKNQMNRDQISPTSSASTSLRALKNLATCQFCGKAMLKKNIPTHIRRAHTPKEELICLNEEQNIFTFQHLKPGQRRKRSARAYDYSLMTATVSIDEDPNEGIENKFITEGEEILSTDLLELADRIKYGISQIPNSTLTKLIDILAKIESTTREEICANAKAIKNMICVYLTSGEEFKYKLKQVGGDIIEKKKQVSNLRADLKEVMNRKAQLERRIQPLVCELQKLEDHHGELVESISQLNGNFHFELLDDLAE